MSALAIQSDHAKLHHSGLPRTDHAPVTSESASADLIAGCQREDRDAQRKLYELHHRRVFSLAVRMVGSEDAVDVAQQVFMKVFAKIHQFAGRSQLETWLYRVTVNECLQHQRRNQKRRLCTLEAEPIDRSSRHAVHVEQVELLERAMSDLDIELKSIFLMREVERRSYAEIAAALAIPEGTVGSRLNRARRQLQQSLREFGWSPGP